MYKSTDKVFKKVIVLLAFVYLAGCVGGNSQKDMDKDLDIDGGAETTSDVAAGDSGNANADGFSDFEGSEPQAAQNNTADSDLAIENELVDSGDTLPPTADSTVADQAAPADTGLEEDPFAAPIADQAAETQPPAPDIPAETPPADVASTPDPVVTEPIETEPLLSEPAPSQVASSSTSATTITGLKYQANESGGTLVVQATGPLQYTTRSNPEMKQFIIDVENAILPKHLTRNLNTRDIKGAIGTIDAYQNPGSTTARFVIQLREGASDPAVQSEGNSMLIVASPYSGHSGNQVSAAGSSGAETSVNVNLNDEKILSSQNLSDFMSGNTKFYGKKISIETNDMDVRDALKFLTDETGINMVIADEVKGNLSLKLREVPWDQALVMIMKARKLGYTRQGNVLRIAPISDLRQEENDAAKLASAREEFEPLKVRMFPVSYAKVDELEKKIKDFLSKRGKAVGDVRTNSLVVTDVEDSLSRISSLITSLDTQPPQVLIEGKIVEASENFTRTIGVRWDSSGENIKIGASKRGPVNMRPSLGINQSLTPSGSLLFGLNIGTMDILGSLSASLALNEIEDNVKVISSPRIVTLSNEPANITQTTEIPIKSVTTVVGSPPSESFQFKPLTLKLDVTPQVTADASVIMNVLVNRQVEGAAESGNSGQKPINSREAKTKVLVKNGQTAVIGGIYQSDAAAIDRGVPWFKDVPVLGYLFKSSETTKRKIELLIFLTPRILGQNESTASATSHQEL